MKTYVLCGGGSGGHITPLLAVAHALKSDHPSAKVVYIGERGGKFAHIADTAKVFDERHYISAGKLRRYHGESWLRRAVDVKTNILNARDAFRMMRGVIQARKLFRNLNADAVLLKGGFVCVPAAMGARAAGVPIITHDSDAVPGLSNRIAARYAQYHATAMPAQYYSYPQASVRHVGLPVDTSLFRQYSAAEQRFLREKYNINQSAMVVLITGGSNGARRMNAWCIDALQTVLDAYPDLHVIHVVGPGNEAQYDALPEGYGSRIHAMDFTREMHHLSAISDIVITRAGASTLTEFAAARKACIVIPSPDLAGGHQLKNAQVYEEAAAAVVLQESQLRKSVQPLKESLINLIENDDTRKRMADALHRTLPKVPAASALAKLLEEVAK